MAPRRRHDDPPDDQELAERRRELLRAYVDSVPPPADLIAASGRFEARFEPESSAIHDLRELQRLQRATDTNAMAVRLEEERDRRIAAEAKLDKRSERLWLALTGAAAIVLAAFVVWVVVTLIKADRPEPTPHAHPPPAQTRASPTERAV